MTEAVKSEQFTATGTVDNVAGFVYGLVLTPDGTNAATVVLRDGGSGGTIKLSLRTPGTESKGVSFKHPIAFGTDIHVTLTGTGAACEVQWKPSRGL